MAISIGIAKVMNETADPIGKNNTSSWMSVPMALFISFATLTPSEWTIAKTAIIDVDMMNMYKTLETVCLARITEVVSKNMIVSSGMSIPLPMNASTELGWPNKAERATAIA